MKYSGHHLLFRLKCLESKGNSFQKLFERIMILHDKTFMPVKPSGQEGDWKCDGYSAGSQTVFQCYAPDELTSGKTSRKIREDFAGAEKAWGRKMRRWTFVWNADALPPQVVATLVELTNIAQDRHEITQLGPERLWEEIVSKLSSSELVELLGDVPVSSQLYVSQLRLAGKALRRREIELAKELCREVLEEARKNKDLNEVYVEACNLMVASCLSDKDTKAARDFLEQASGRLTETTRPVLRAQFFQVKGALLLCEGRGKEAEVAFMHGLEIPESAATSKPDKGVPVAELQCGIRADLVLYLAQTNQTARAVEHANLAELYIKDHHEAQDEHLLSFVTDSLISLAIRLNDLDRAKRSLQLLESHCGSREQLGIAAKLLQKLTGRAAHCGATDIAMECCNLSSKLALQADLTEDFWAAQFNGAGIYLQIGEVTEAQKRLQTLWPLLGSDDVPNAMKAAFLVLASELATEQGDDIQAVELQQKALSYADSEPFDLAACSFRLARKLKAVGRVEEACEAFEVAARVGRECDAPGEFLFDVLAPWCESEILLGHWDKAEGLLGEVAVLPRPVYFEDGVVENLRKQLDGSKEIRRRIEEVRNISSSESTPSLAEANATAIKPLLDWWQEITSRVSIKDTQEDAGLSILYDFWGSGSAVEVMANLRRFAPDHFSPFIEVRSIADIRRALRMFSLFSDTLVLLWKGPIKGGRVMSAFPFDHVKGGAGYIFALGSKAFDSSSSGPWFFAMGQGAYLPEEVCKFLATEAASLLSQGRLLLLPAPAVGCWEAHHGPCENVLADLIGASLLINKGTSSSDFPVGIVPYFEDAPLSAIGDLLGENPDQARRLRLALLKRTRELRAHQSPEGASRELRDEINDAFAQWRDLHQQVARRYHWHNEEDQMAVRTLSFQNQWSPVLTLSRLGYRWSIGSVGEFKSEATEFQVERDTPLGNWLIPPYKAKLLLAVKEDEQEPSD